MLRTGDFVRVTASRESKVVLISAGGVVIAAHYAGEGKTYDPDELTLLDQGAAAGHDRTYRMDDELGMCSAKLLCPACVYELGVRADSCPRCTADLAVLIDDKRSDEAAGIDHARGCRAVQ